MTEFLSYYIVIVTNYHNSLEINYWVISAFWILLYVLVFVQAELAAWGPNKSSPNT